MVQKHTYSRRRNGYRIKIINFYDVAKKKKIRWSMTQISLKFLIIHIKY